MDIKEKNIKILIAMHKPYKVPVDSMYVPLQVGAALHERIKMSDCRDDASPDEYLLTDNLGDNISAKNPYYCELTAMYFAWKNLTCDALGLVHYRRYFGVDRHAKTLDDKLKCIFKKTEIDALLDEYDILVPKKRNYYIESLYSHYAHTFDGMHLDMAADIIRNRFPEYAQFIDPVYKSSKGCMFNMFIMKRKYVDDYCYFLFSVLCEMEDKLDLSSMDDFNKRLFGRVSEILFNVWLAKQLDCGVAVKELPHMHMEPVNWIKKGSSFLSAKFLGKKYTKSF